MSYITTEQLLSYCAARNIDLTAYSEADIDASVVLAADFFDIYYTFYPELSTYETLPQSIISAQCEAAVMQLKGLLFVDNSQIASGSIVSKTESLDGVGSTSVTYASGGASTYKRNTPVIDALVRPYLAQNSGKVYRL